MPHRARPPSVAWLAVACGAAFVVPPADAEAQVAPIVSPSAVAPSAVAPASPPATPAVPQSAPGLVPTLRSDVRLTAPDPSTMRETGPDKSRSSFPRDEFQLAVFGAWAGAHGPFVGASVGMYRAIRIDIGAAHATKTKQSCVGRKCTEVADGWGDLTLAVGYSAALVSFSGLEASLGLLTVGSQVSPLARVTVPLYAAWLPFRIDDARMFLHFPVGIGFEWGRP